MKKALEGELWEKMDRMIGDVKNIDYFDYFNTLEGKEFLEEIEREDFILGLAGIDPEADERIEARRKNLKQIKKELKVIKKRRKTSQKNWKEQQNKIRELK